MASVTNVIGLLESFIKQNPDTQQSLDWPPGILISLLNQCPTPVDTLRWHRNFMRKIVDINDSSLEQLCVGVAKCIVRATTKLEELRLRSSGRFASPNRSTDRQAVISALNDIIAAFNQFSIVNTEDDLGRLQVRDVVLSYLRKTYELMITIRWVLEPCSADHDWLVETSDYLRESELQNFRFDSARDYADQINGMEEALIPHATVPPNCMPAFPQIPVLTLNTGPYGARVVRNDLYEPNDEHSLLVGVGVSPRHKIMQRLDSSAHDNCPA